MRGLQGGWAASLWNGGLLGARVYSRWVRKADISLQIVGGYGLASAGIAHDSAKNFVFLLLFSGEE